MKTYTPNNKMSSEPLNEAIRQIRNKLNIFGYQGHLLSYLQEKSMQLEDIILRTGEKGESNSVLIIGPAGSGKSALLESVLESVFKNSAVKGNMFHVHLNGLVHRDDNSALEEIAKALKMVEDEDKSLGSCSEKLRLLLAALKSGNEKSKSVLFVLDHFDQFCFHKNQTLLYNLFDIAQSKQAPICVIGMCNRPDLLQTLENRVSSRFSHQKISLFEEKMTEKDYFDQAARDFLSLQGLQDGRFQKRWNEQISKLFKDPQVKKVMEHLYLKHRNLRDLKKFLYLVFMPINQSKTSLTPEDFSQTFDDHYRIDVHAAMMSGLSNLEVSLLVAMMHLTEIHGEQFNFEIAFKEVERFLRCRLRWNIEKAVVMKSFEHLLELELVGGTASSNMGLKRYDSVRLLVAPYEVKDAVRNYQNLPMQLKHWTESSIDG